MTRTAIACLAIGLALAACGSDGAATETVSLNTAFDTTEAPVSPGDDPIDITEPTTPATTDTTASNDTADDLADETPIGGGQGAIGTIEVSITYPEADTVEYTIGCMGDTFPVTPDVPQVDGATACERLADPAVVERLVKGPPGFMACTQIYGGPDVARITGEIDGQQVDASIDRTDGCGIADWDNLLAGVLPPARGVS